MNNFTPNAKYINHEVDIKKFKKVLTDLSIVLSYDLEACKDIINIKYGHLKGISYPIFKECLFAFLNKKLDILTSMFFAEQHSVPIDQLKRVAESDIPGDQPIPLNAQEEEMKRIKETLSLTDDVNLIILHRSIYVLKKKFEEFNKEIKEIYKEYNENDNEEEGVVVDVEKVEEIVKRIGRKCLFEVDKKEFKDAVVDELCYAGGDMFRNGEVMERLVEFVGRERRKYNKIFKVKKERKEVDLKEFEGYNGENEEEDDMCKVVIEPIEEEVNEEEREEEGEEKGEEGEDNEGNEELKEGEGDEEKKEESNNEVNEDINEGNEDGKEDVDKSKSNENNESNNEGNNDEERKEGNDEKKSENVEEAKKNGSENEEEKKEDDKNENKDDQKEKDKNDNEEEEEEEEEDDDKHEEKENEEKEKDEDENEIKNEEEKSVTNKEDSIDMKQSNDLKSNIDDKLSNIPNNDNISKSKSNLNNSHITNNNNNENANLSNSNQDALQPSTPPPEQSETKSLHSTKPPLQKEYKKYYLYIETLPLILADFLTSTPLSIILERNPSNLTNLRVLFDNEIMSRLGEETTYQIHLLKSERLKECLFSLSKIETNITHYNSILTQKQLQNENTTYITAMLNKLTSTKNFLTNTINTIQNDTNTYNEYQDKQGNYLQDQTTTELNQTKPSNAMTLINNTNNEIQQQLPSINDISNIDNNNQHQSNILNETVSYISNNNNNNNNVQPPSSAVVRFQTSVSSALSSARVNNNSKNYSHSRILLKQPLTKEQKRVNAIKEIFTFYARQHVNNNQIGTFDSLKLKLEHMNLSEFSKFCSEFQLLIPKDKRSEIFKKNISNTNTITINEFNNILPQLAKAIRDDKVNRLKKQILQNKLLLRHYKEQDDKKIIENISESIIVYKYANIDEQINKDKDEIKSLLKKDETILLEELYTYLEIDDEKKYRSKMKGFIAHSGKLILPKIQSENRIKNITERTKYEVKSMLTQHKLQMERDAEEKRKVEGMHKEYQKKQLEVFNRLYDKALKQRDKLERERKKVNEVKFIQPTNRVDNPFRRYYKAESVIHGMWKHAEHNKGFDDAYYNVVPQFKEEVKKNKKEDKEKARKVVRFVGEKVMEGGVKEKEMDKDVSVRDDEGNKDDMWGNKNSNINRKKSAFTWESLEKMSINEFKEREDIARLLGVNDL